MAIRNYSKERNPYVVFMDGDQWEVVSFVSDPMGMPIATNISTKEDAQQTADQFWTFDQMEERIQPVNHIIRLVRDGYVDDVKKEPEIWTTKDIINIDAAMKIAEEGEFTEESIQKGKAFLEEKYGKEDKNKPYYVVFDDSRLHWKYAVINDTTKKLVEEFETRYGAEAYIAYLEGKKKEDLEKNPPFIHLDTSTQLHKPYIVYGGETTHIMDSFETRKEAQEYIEQLKENRPGKKEYDTSL